MHPVLGSKRGIFFQTLAVIGALAWALPSAAVAKRVAAPTTAHPAAPGPSTVALERELAAMAGAAKGSVGVAAWRLDGRGPKVLLNAADRFPMASTYKVAIAGTVLAAVDAGRLRLDQMVTVEVRHRVPSDIIAERLVHPGVALSVHNLLELMLTESDNTATDMLMELAGGPAAVTGWVQKVGVADLRVDRSTDTLIRDFYGLPAAGSGETMAQLVAARPELEATASRPNPAFDDDPRDTATPVAMAMLLTRLFSGAALAPTSTQVIVDIMGRCRTGVNRLKGRLPDPTEIAHKTGTIGGTVNDVGVMTLPANGGAIVIAVFIKKSEAPMEQRERVIAEVARSVRDFYLYVPME